MLAKQANADQLQLLHRNSHSAGAVSDPPQPASASDPSIAFLQPADFILTSSVRLTNFARTTHVHTDAWWVSD